MASTALAGRYIATDMFLMISELRAHGPVCIRTILAFSSLARRGAGLFSSLRPVARSPVSIDCIFKTREQQPVGDDRPAAERERDKRLVVSVHVEATMNVMCPGYLHLVDGGFSTTAGFAELVGRRPGITVDPETNSVYGLQYDAGRPATRGPPENPLPATGQGTCAEPQASAAKRRPGTTVSTVKAKNQRTTQKKSTIAPLPATALDDKSLEWNRLMALVICAKLEASVSGLVQTHGVDSTEARAGLVAELKNYIEDPQKPPLPIAGREGVPKVFMVSDSKHASKHNPARPNTDVKWFYWEEGNGRGQKWFGEEPAGYKAAPPAAPAAATSTDADTGADPPRSPRQACIVTLPGGSPSLLNATLRLIDSPTSGALTGTVSTGNLLYKRQQRGDNSEVEDLCGNSGWISDKYLKEIDGTKTSLRTMARAHCSPVTVDLTGDDGYCEWWEPPFKRREAAAVPPVEYHDKSSQIEGCRWSTSTMQGHGVDEAEALKIAMQKSLQDVRYNRYKATRIRDGRRRCSDGDGWI
jgi:hypothetical protein